MTASNQPNGTSNSIHNNNKFLYDNESIINRFKQFIQLRTITEEMPATGLNYKALDYLTELFNSIGIQTKIHEFIEKRPILIATWEGSNKNDKSILLNSHYDVVPVDSNKWSVDAFSGIEKDDWIYGRGTQDMKCVCMGYIEAIAKLKQQGYKPQRTVHISFMPDEENSGRKGMGNLVKSDVLPQLNIGFALDEGLANETDKMTVFNGERAIWWLTVKATGNAGHGSRFVKNTATPKLINAINKFLEFRKQQEELLECEHANCSHAIKKKNKLGNVVTTNLTYLKSGVVSDDGQHNLLNVIPTEAVAGFDIRVPPTTNMQELEAMIKDYTSSDPDVTYDFIFKVTDQSITDTNPDTNPYWRIFTESMQQHNIQTDIEIFPAGTDARYVRELSVPAIGFSPMNNTPILLHDHDERIHRDTYLRGIDIYQTLISKLASDKL